MPTDDTETAPGRIVRVNGTDIFYKSTARANRSSSSTAGR